MTATLFDLGGPIAPASKAPKAPAAPRGGRRKAAASTPAQPPASAIHHAAPTEPAPAPTPPVDEEPAIIASPVDVGPAPIRGPIPLPPFDPDDTSFYALSYRLLRMSRAELDALDEKHRAAGFGIAPSPDALAGAISACAPRERPAGPWVTCEFGAVMLEDQHAEHLARATRPGVWSLHNVFMASRAERASASSGDP